MKLIRAKFQNFRLLRDLELEFSTDDKKRLTVIRAANDSGKTTIFQGLQWAFYGDDALPNEGKDFRLYPVGWDVEEQGEHVSVHVIVEFETTTSRKIRGEYQKHHRRYRLVRSVSEYVDSKNRRSASTPKLFELKESGAEEVPSPEPVITDNLPPELREVFFTDGDRTLNFIEAKTSPKDRRERVENAIRSLLGLEIIAKAINRLEKSAKEINKKAKKISDDESLNKVLANLEMIENKQEELEERIEDAETQFESFDEELNQAVHFLYEAIEKGNKEDLSKELKQVHVERKQIDDEITKASKDHSELFQSQSIAENMIAPILDNALKKLEELHAQGKIPTTTIPVLQDRLEEGVCICGETLKMEDPHGKTRRVKIKNLIENNRKSDKLQKILTSLYYETRTQEDSNAKKPKTWIEDYKNIHERRDKLDRQRDKTGRRHRILKQKIDSLPDTDVQQWKARREELKQCRDGELEKKHSYEAQLANIKRERIELESERDTLLSKQRRSAHILAEQKIVKDAIDVLNRSYKRITDDELPKVSDLMNKIFLEMIGADPEQGAIIRRTEINQEFDILVYGPKNRVLNPGENRDVNGASQRALAIAFILALSKVSEVEAPNVIDTPLGATSGFVKHSILRTSVRESKQLILFLTHDEIHGCEDIIDEFAGVVFTLTNTTHYPEKLVNDPCIIKPNVLRCNCNHRRYCKVCQRIRKSGV